MNSFAGTPSEKVFEIFQGLPEGTLAELIDNEIFMSPAPLLKHQLVLNDINVILYQYFKTNAKGVVLISPLDVYLDEKSNVVQPDLIVILNETKGIISKNKIRGVPDLLVEVLSPNQRHDLVIKKGLYERFGVKEYWVIDPDSKLVKVFTLGQSKYTVYAEDVGLIKSKLLSETFAF